MAASSVRVVGMRELQAALRRVDTALPRQLRLAGNAAVAGIVTGAQARARSQGGVAAKTAPSIRAASEQRAAAVKIGGARYPFALGAEFGAQRFRQFEPWRGNQWVMTPGVGYFLHPEIVEHVRSGALVDAFDAALDLVRVFAA